MPTTTQNFNGVTPPALPAGYSLSPATGNGIVTTATGARSGNCITQSAPDVGNLGFLNYFLSNTAYSSSSDQIVDVYVNATAGVLFSCVARANSPTDPQTCYIGALNVENSPFNFLIYKRVAGVITLIATQPGAAGTGEGLASLGAGYARMILTVSGNVITLEALGASGEWAKPDGTSQTTRTPVLTVTDNSIPATGVSYMGIAWEKGTVDTAVFARADDLSITGTAAGGATTFAISPPTQRRSEFVGNRSFPMTVTPDGTGTDTLTLSDGSGGGTFQNAAGTTITTLVWAGDGATKTFFYTPGSAGAKTISGTVPGKTVTGGFTFTAVATRAARDFYVSAAGNDTNPGTIGSPFLTTARMQEIPYMPGDRRLLRAGDIFLPFAPLDAGTNGARIVTTSYSTANSGRAKILAGDVNGVTLLNTSYNTIDLLEIIGPGFDTTTGATTSGTATPTGKLIRETGNGVHLKSSTATGTLYSGNKVTNCWIHGFFTGILTQSEVSDPAVTPDGFNTLEFSDNKINSCLQFGIYTFGGTGNTGLDNGFGFTKDYLHTAPYMARNEVYDIPGDPLNPIGGGVALQINNCINGLNERNVSYNCTRWTGRDAGAIGGGGGEILLSCKNYIVQDCESYGHTTGLTFDACAFDIDGNCESCTIQRCYAHGCYGPGFMHGTYVGGVTSRKNTFRWNISVGNGQNPQLLGGTLPQSEANDFGNGDSEAWYYGNLFIAKPSAASQKPVIFSASAAGSNTRADSNIRVITASGQKFVRYTGTGYSGDGNRDYALPGVAITNSWKYNNTDYSTQAAYKSGSGKEAASTYADPMLRDVTYQGTLGIGVLPSTITAFDAESGGALALAGINLSALGLSGYPALNGTDLRGNTRAATSLQVGPSATLYVPGGGDTTPPTLSALAIPTAGNIVTGTLSESGCLPISGTGGFTLTGTAGSRTVTSWAISGTTLTLTLSGVVYSPVTDTPLLTYNRAATTNDIADAAGNFLANFTASSVTNNSTQTAPTTVATPVFSPVAGSFSLPQDVTITTVTSGADIYYTTNGTTPTTASTLYTAPVSVSLGTTVLKAIAVKAGSIDSAVRTGSYVIGDSIGIGTGNAPTAEENAEAFMLSEVFIGSGITVRSVLQDAWALNRGKQTGRGTPTERFFDPDDNVQIRADIDNEAKTRTVTGPF